MTDWKAQHDTLEAYQEKPPRNDLCTADDNPRCISDAALQDRRGIVVDGNGDYIAEILGSDHIDRGGGGRYIGRPGRL